MDLRSHIHNPVPGRQASPENENTTSNQLYSGVDRYRFYCLRRTLSGGIVKDVLKDAVVLCRCVLTAEMDDLTGQ